MPSINEQRPSSLNLNIKPTDSVLNEKSLKSTVSKLTPDNGHAINTGDKIYAEFKNPSTKELYVSQYDLKSKYFDIQKVDNDGNLCTSALDKKENYLPQLISLTYSVLSQEKLDTFNNIPNNPESQNIFVADLASSISDIKGPDVIFNTSKIGTKQQSGAININNENLFDKSIEVKNIDACITSLTPQNSLFFDMSSKASIAADLNINDLNSLIDKFSLSPLDKDTRDKILNCGFVPNDLFVKVLSSTYYDVLLNRDMKDAGQEFHPISGYFYGPSSGGKTFAANMLAGILNLPFRSIECGPDTTEKNLLFNKEIKYDPNPITLCKESPLIDVLKNGGVIIIDEANNIGNPNVLTTLNNIIANGIFELPAAGTPIIGYDGKTYLSSGGLQPINENAIILFAGNDCYGKSLPPSLIDRAQENGLVVSFDIPSGEVMLDRLQKNPRYQAHLDIIKERNDLSDKQLSEINDVLTKFSKAVQIYNDNTFKDLSSSAHSSTGEAFITSRDFNSIIHLALSNMDLYPSFQHSLLQYLSAKNIGLSAKHLLDRGSEPFSDVFGNILSSVGLS